MARITLEMHHLKRSSSGKTPLGIAQPLTSPPKRRDPDVLIMGVRKLKLLNAIERALEEADHPLDADDIAYIIADNRWARPFRRNPRETIQDALTRHFSSGNQLDIEVIEDGKTCRYWLRRKGTPRSKQSRAFPHES
jgi:hypothetical protein